MKLTILTFACALMLVRTSAAELIGGIVKGADGSTITTGQVSASREADSLRLKLGRTSASAAIRPDGTFQLPELVGGSYRICARAPGTTWIDSCQWGLQGTTVSLSASQPSPNVTIVLKKGALVIVRVDDPAQLLSIHEGKTPGAHLLMGVGTDSHFFQAAAVASQDGAGRNYQLLIPFDRPINISVGSGFFQLSDATGRVLPKFGNLIPVLVPSGQQPATLRLTVSGRNSP